ncbi:hypothetical protein [Halodurantibacterium flavum]|uniref:Uncharacterized protein n=1 Tax=Halodurantibacterium flavum TaxID=1382802 RepID=A0ABW4S047_9RHOB
MNEYHDRLTEMRRGLPPALSESMARHEENLLALVASMNSAGFGEADIRACVQQLLQVYEAELVQVLTILREEGADDHRA